MFSIDEIKKVFPHEILEAIKEVQQPRSKFQLEHFVLNQHDTEEMRYYQVLLEIGSMYDTLKTIDFEMRKKQIQIKRLKESSDELDAIEVEELEFSLETTNRLLVGTFRELSHLIDLYNSFPVKYSREQLETAQPDYWMKRLTRQVNLDLLGNNGNVNPANLDALRQIGALEDFITEKQASISLSQQKELEN